ncbi:flagellar biosynthetic protein FliO [Xenorhabdus bovienii]|uniref:flagellar biosynthetic protein FliO n=1 Tax=Xenorhabdus bovienii TaxID=40576 RepID=UPI0023B2441F|nr:flagellar biosynthetic protein FliO [Xenorhabdus bovienii]MDE9432698.1 flagellar biosynthetic protein FliO [Xenorhabdus bovienii]MDE9490474.1 flagellar biosynthetic protein FliO [Xenorhabdus bovienii]MDE9507625.1 flagellar biosynthetic protein FliO [Xenorhabdus bovienii]MDE9549194.1 flagellar biosynthetic protein FliO [Xenorhabdus bovienii]
MMANQPSLYASFQHGAASDAAPVNAKANTLSANTVKPAASPEPLPASQTLMQVSSALGGILLLIFVMTWLIRRLGLAPAKNKNHRLLNVKASCSLGPKERVVVLEIEDSWLVLGVTPQQINVLHQMPVPSDNAEKETALKTLPFSQMLKNTLQRKSKNDKDDDEK